MALLPAASHAHRPCQSAERWAGAGMTVSKQSTRPPSPSEATCSACATCCFRLCHQHQAVRGPAPTSGGMGHRRVPLFRSLHPKSEWVGSCWAVRGTRDSRRDCLFETLLMGALTALQGKSDTRWVTAETQEML